MKNPNNWHHKFGECENCGTPVLEGHSLTAVEFWDQLNGKRIPSYLYVCETCFESRKTWCKNIFTDSES